jgi:hypothetical protein
MEVGRQRRGPSGLYQQSVPGYLRLLALVWACAYPRAGVVVVVRSTHDKISMRDPNNVLAAVLVRHLIRCQRSIVQDGSPRTHFVLHTLLATS